MIGSYYDHVFLERLEANLCYDKYGVQRPLPENQGNTVVWHALKNPSVGYVLTEGTTPGASAMSARKVSATLVWYADLRSVTDVVDATAVCPVVEETVAAMGYGAALTKDAYISDVIGFGSACSTGVASETSATIPSVNTMGFPLVEPNTGVAYWSRQPMSNGLFSTVPAIAGIRKTVTVLKQLAAVPFEDGNYRGIVHPYVSDYIRGDSNFATWMAYTNRAAMEKGKLGVIEKVLFEESQTAFNVPLGGSVWSGAVSTGSVFGTLIFGKGAYGVTKLRGQDVKVSVVSGADKSDPLNQRTYIGYKMAFTAKILNPSAGAILTWFRPGTS